MKILFISPPNYRFRKVNSQHIMLGPMYLARILMSHHDVLYYDAEAPTREEARRNLTISTSFSHMNQFRSLYVDALIDSGHEVWREVEQIVSEHAPDVVGISSMTNSFPAALQVARIAKKVGVPTVIMGGTHVNICPQDAAWDDHVDYVVRGEAEITIVELIRALENGREPVGIPGVCYVKDGDMVMNPERERITDLDTIPIPDHSVILHLDRYSKDDFARIIAGRGCPNSCRYCSSNIHWGKAFRYRSVDNIYEEMVGITRFGNNFRIMDDNLMASKKTVIGLSKKIIENGLDVEWRCCSRVDSLSEERLRIARAAGCWDVVLGLESGSDRILAYMNKKLTVDKMMRSFDKVLNSGLNFTANFMFGLPEETMEDLYATLDFIKWIPAGNIAVYKFIPLPGTPLYDEVLGRGVFGKEGPRYEHLDQFSRYYHYSRHISRGELDDFAREIYAVVEEKNRKTRSKPPRQLTDEDFPFLRKAADGKRGVIK